MAAGASAAAPAKSPAWIDSNSPANEDLPGGDRFCAQLADIGRQAFQAKHSGYPLGAVLETASAQLTHDRDKQEFSMGVITTVYQDRSLKNGGEAYETVYAICKKELRPPAG